MTPIVHYAVMFGVACFSVGLLMNLWRMLRGPRLMDRLLAVDTMVVNVMALVVLAGLVAGSGIYFEAALLFSLTGFVSTVAFARFILRGNIIE